MAAANFLYLLPGQGDLAAVFVIDFFIGVFAGNLLVMAWSMLMDIIARDGERAGPGRGGVFAGIWSAGEKASVALGALAAGLLLQAFDFHPSAEGFIAQSASAHLGIRLAIGLLPSIGLLLSLMALSGFGRESRPAEPQIA
jgi:Na+/melibiose symporter-like transporter